MTAGNNGSPENDDPFAYLYHGEGDTSKEPAPDRPGVPRTSHNQVKRVGERQYGGQQQGGYGYPPQQQQQQQQPQRRSAPQGSGRGNGPNSKALLIGAVAVVAAVLITIGVVMMNGNKEESVDDPKNPVPTAAAGEETGEPTTDPTGKDEKFESLSEDASGLVLGGSVKQSTQVKGAGGAGGMYAGPFTQAGDSATWTFEAPKSGAYTVFADYGVPGKDAESVLTVNGKAQSLSMKNWAGAAEGDWEKGWSTTYGFVQLEKGSNTVAVSCGAADKCNFNLDTVALLEGHVTKK